MQRLVATVHGRVQGVGFRYFVREQASSLGLTGWTRNRLAGTVEVVAEGEAATIEVLLAALRQGPRISRVTDVDHRFEDALREFEAFTIEGTV